MKSLKQQFDVLGNYCSLLLVLQFYIGLFYVLDVLGITVRVFLEGEYVYRAFSVGYDFTNLLLLLLFVWTILAARGCGRRAGNIAGRTRRLGAVFCRHVDGLAGVALHPDRGPDLCCKQRAVLGDRAADGATITAAGCPVHLPAGDPGAHCAGPVVDGLSRPGRGTAAVDPVAGSGLLVIRRLTAR